MATFDLALSFMFVYTGSCWNISVTTLFKLLFTERARLTSKSGDARELGNRVRNGLANPSRGRKQG